MTINTKENIMGTEPIGKLFLKLAIPTVTAQLVNLLYNIVDRMYVGRIPGSGSNALAGLGITFPIIMLVSAFSALIGIGGAARASIAMGQKDNATAEKILGNSTIMLFLSSIVLTIVFLIFKKPILLTFGASQNTLPYANDYVTIYLIGTVFVLFSLGLNQFITNQGFAKISMATVCIGAVINIILDPILIFGFNMGVKGAAIATIVSQAVSAVWVLSFLTSKKSIIKIKFSNFKLNPKIVAAILTLGISPFAMQSTECLVQLVFNTGMLKYGNDMYVALMSVLFSIMQLAWMPMQGLAQGASPIIGYNFGAKKFARVKKSFKLLLAVDLAYSIIFVGLVEIFPSFFLRMFTDDIELINLGKTILRVYMCGMIIMGAQGACQQTFLALGKAKISMILAFLRKLVLILPLALILPCLWNLGTWGLILAEPISDVIAVTATTIIFYFTSKKFLKE